MTISSQPEEDSLEVPAPADILCWRVGLPFSPFRALSRCCHRTDTNGGEAMQHTSARSSGSIHADSAEMRSMEISTSVDNEVEAHNATRRAESSWIPSFSGSSLTDIVAYFGVRGVAFLVVLKILAVVVFALFLFGPSSGSTGDYSTVSLVGGRPEGLREMVRQSSKAAAANAEHRSLFTLKTRSELVYDDYIEFILSYPSTLDDSTNTDGDNAGDAESWVQDKSEVSTISTSSSLAEVAAARAAAKEQGGDPLSVATIDPALLVHSFAKDAQNGGATIPYSILLNKFNTVKDHCLIVSDTYAPQLSPLRGAELELLHWVLLQTRGVGFYNSNLMAGASQAHKHTQFIPGDAIWSLRNPDAPHALPIDDVIMPKIESGRWQPYPYVPRAQQHPGGAHYASSVENKKRFESGRLHQLPQYEFQHAVAVLLDRSAFIHHPHALEAYSDYLQSVYEALLLVNDVSIEALQQCADADLSSDSPTSRRALQSGADSDDLVSEGNLAKGASSLRAHNSGAKAHQRAAAAVAPSQVRAVDCLQDVGYNLILRPQYMMLVPRGKKDFAHTVNINSFGFMGLFLATKEVSRQLIKDVGPLEILKSVGKPLTTRMQY